MKRLLLTLALVAAAAAAGPAQDFKQAVDEVIANNGKNVSMLTDKQLLEPGESARLQIVVDVYPPADPTDETIALTRPETIELKPGNPLYDVRNWRIVSGGGNLVTIDATNASYTAPPRFGAARQAVISVDLVPKAPKLPRVELLTTVYFDENDTAFVLNVPDYGIVNLKLVDVPVAGVTVPKIDPRVAGQLTPEMRRQLEQAQRELDKANEGRNLEVLSSGAFALFDPEQGFTAVKLRSFRVAAGVGMDAGLRRDATLEWNYNGRDAGRYDLGVRESKTGLGLLLAGTGYGCGDFGDAEFRGDCDGVVVIDKVDPQFVTGNLRATVWTSRPGDKHVHRGTFYGKFRVRRAN